MSRRNQAALNSGVKLCCVMLIEWLRSNGGGGVVVAEVAVVIEVLALLYGLHVADVVVKSGVCGGNDGAFGGGKKAFGGGKEAFGGGCVDSVS